MKHNIFFRASLAMAVTIITAASLAITPSHAASLDGITPQSSCDSGDGVLTWSGLELARPQIASMTVDGETIVDPANPTAGGIGATICASVEKARIISLAIIRRDADGSDHQDLDTALTPSGNPITARSKIAISLTNMGDTAKYYTFSLVHGVVTSWTTAHLGSDSASLNVTLSPVRTPLGTGDDFSYCTATPPNCHAAKSDADIMSASLYMGFDQSGAGKEFMGSYFGLVSAMGGFVQSVKQSDGTSALTATLGAPHALADGETPNVGSLQAYLPNAVIEGLFGLKAGTVDTASLTVTRTDAGTESASPFSVTPVTGGVIVKLTDITFSSPTYTIKKAPIVTPLPAVASSSSSSSNSSTTQSPSSTQSSKTTAKDVPTAVIVTPNKDKSTVRVDGSNIVADGKASYRVVTRVNDKNGTVITDQKPEFMVDQSLKVTITNPVLVGGEWVAYATSTTAGDKAVTVKVGGVQLSDAKMAFLTPPVVVTPKAATKKVVKQVPTLPAEPADHTTAMALLGGGVTILLGGLWLFARSTAGARLLARLKGVAG